MEVEGLKPRHEPAESTACGRPTPQDVREIAARRLHSIAWHRRSSSGVFPCPGDHEPFDDGRYTCTVADAVLAAVEPVIRRQVAEETAEQQRRFWSFVVFNGVGGCWVWQGGKINGYGQFHPTRDVIARAHRWAYETLVGPIPEGLTLDHRCENRACVNPDHLEPATIGENALRGNGPAAANKRKTECPQGHPYDATNTWLDGRGKRYCLTCKRLANQDYGRRRRAAAAIARSHSTREEQDHG